MKTVLVILTQANLTSLQVNESLAATVKVLLKDAALSLLQNERNFDQLQHAFKIASNMVDSFEFYDLSPILIEDKNKQHPFVQKSEQKLEFVQLDTELIQSFDHVLYW